MVKDEIVTVKDVVHRLQLCLLEGIHDEDKLFAAGSLMSQDDYQDVVTERNYTRIINSRDRSGKLMLLQKRSLSSSGTEFIRLSGPNFPLNIKSATLMLHLNGLSGPTGLAVSKDGTYLVVSEFIRNPIRWVWLKGPMALHAETLVELLGSPDNIKRTVNGEFWVAVTVAQPLPVQTVSSLAVRFNGFGMILESINLTPYYNGTMITEVQEFFKRLYIAPLSPNLLACIWGLGIDQVPF